MTTERSGMSLEQVRDEMREAILPSDETLGKWADAIDAHLSRDAVVSDSHNGMQACAMLVRAVISDDAYAVSFQSMGQYRAALIAKIDGFIAELFDKKAMLAQRDGGTK